MCKNPLIIVVEDNQADVRLIVEAFKESKNNYAFKVISDGEDALNYFEKEGSAPADAKPDLIILDLMLPKKSGLDILTAIKANPVFMKTPVIVMTSSAADGDFTASYNLDANCCIRKPVTLENFFDVVRNIEEFWFSTAKLPEKSPL